MIPANGHKISPIDPDRQDDYYERMKIVQQYEAQELIDFDDPRFVDMDEYEVNPSFSVRRNPVNYR